MTNLIPKHRFAEKLAREQAAALRNGHGVPLIGAPKQPQRQMVRLDIGQSGPLADMIGSQMQPGNPVPVGMNEAGPIWAALPDFGAYAAHLMATWTAPLTDDQADHLALVNAVATCQKEAGAVFARWKARHAAAVEAKDKPQAEGSAP